MPILTAEEVLNDEGLDKMIMYLQGYKSGIALAQRKEPTDGSDKQNEQPSSVCEVPRQ